MSTNSDPFEEFEFKPLTEGLGFHKKKEATPETTKSAAAISEIMARMPKDLDFLSENAAKMEPTKVEPVKVEPTKRAAAEVARPKIFQPIAPIEAKSEPKSSSTTALDESVTRAFPHLERLKQKLKFQEKTAVSAPTTLHLGAALLDGMVILGMTFIFLMSVLMIAKVDLVGLLTHPQTESITQFHLLVLFLCVLQLYLLSARSFFGATLGEWAFDMHLGSPEQQTRAVYPLQVVLRTIVMIFTGLILLPIISLIAKKDFGQYFGGLQLFQKKLSSQS